MNKNTEVYKISDKRFKFKYDGNFKNLPKFKKSVCDITLSINPLAWYILNGTSHGDGEKQMAFHRSSGCQKAFECALSFML